MMPPAPTLIRSAFTRKNSRVSPVTKSAIYITRVRSVLAVTFTTLSRHPGYPVGRAPILFTDSESPAERSRCFAILRKRPVAGSGSPTHRSSTLTGLPA